LLKINIFYSEQKLKLVVMEKESNKKKRVDVFADEHIDDGHIIDYFLTYCEVECDWQMDEEQDMESLKHVLKLFVDEHPTFAEKITLD
jgi:hypothetical protein